MILDTSFQKLETEAENIFNQLKGFSSDQLNHHPEPGRWSPLEHLAHVNKVERSMLVLLSKSLRRKEPLKGSVFLSKARSLAYRTWIILGAKIKAPKIVEPEQRIFTLEELQEAFHNTRVQWREVVQPLSPEVLSQFWIHHHYLKEMRIPETLEFLVFHQHHHHQLLVKGLQG